MYEAYRDRVAFLFVYIREAHPDDEWQLESNRADQVVFAQPTTLADRKSIAARCCRALQMTMPCVVDDIHNSADHAYAAWPERLFIVDTTGRIAYAGGQGPFGFEPRAAARWLRRHVGRPASGTRPQR